MSQTSSTAFTAASSLLSGAANRVSSFGSGGQTSISRSLFSRYCLCCSFEFAHQFFDVETDDIINRFTAVFVFWTPVTAAIVDNSENQGRTRASFYRLIKTGPVDLYGPIWIATTLILVTAVCSNLGKYFSKFSFKPRSDEGSDDLVLTDPRVLSFAAYTVYSFAVAGPLISYLYLHYFLDSGEESSSANENFDAFDDNEEDVRGQERRAAINNLRTVGLFDLVCIFGYSFLPFIPAVMLCSIPITQAEIMGLLIGLGWSVMFLLFTLRQVCRYADIPGLFPQKSGTDIERVDSLEIGEAEEDLTNFKEYASMDEMYDPEVLGEKKNVPFLLLLPFTVLHFAFALTLKLKFFSNAGQ